MALDFRKVLLWAAVGAVAPAADVRADCPDDYTYTLIADDTGPLMLSDPNSAEVHAAPSITPDGDVGFRAWLDSGGTGVFGGDGDDLIEIALDRGADVGAFFEYPADIVINSDFQVAFEAFVYPDGSQEGFWGIVLASPGVAPDLVAFGDGGRGLATDYYNVAGSIDLTPDGDVLFVGTLAGFADTAIVRWSGGVTHSDIEASDIDLLNLESPITNGLGDIAFRGRNGMGPWAIYRHPGPFTVAEGDGATGHGPSEPSLGAGGSIAYALSYSSPDEPGQAALRIMRWDSAGTSSTILADSADGDFEPNFNRTTVAIFGRSLTAVPGDGPSASWGGCVVFNGFDPAAEEDSLFVVDEDGLRTVINGNPVFDAIASFAEISRTSANSSGQVAFWANLSDGRQVIVRADPTGDPPNGDDPGAGDDPVGGDDPGDAGVDVWLDAPLDADSGTGVDLAGSGGDDGGCRIAAASTPQMGPVLAVLAYLLWLARRR